MIKIRDSFCGIFVSLPVIVSRNYNLQNHHQFFMAESIWCISQLCGLQDGRSKRIMEEFCQFVLEKEKEGKHEGARQHPAEEGARQHPGEEGARQHPAQERREPGSTQHRRELRLPHSPSLQLWTPSSPSTFHRINSQLPQSCSLELMLCKCKECDCNCIPAMTFSSLYVHENKVVSHTYLPTRNLMQWQELSEKKKRQEMSSTPLCFTMHE